MQRTPVHIHGRIDSVTPVAAGHGLALLNEKPGVRIETEDPDEIIGQLRTAYGCNRLQYAERYDAAVKVLCRKYGVRVAEMNRMIAEDPAVAKEVYAVMDTEFEKDISKLRKRLK